MSTSDSFDEFAKEADWLAVASAVGVVRERHVELGPVDPKFPDTDAQRTARQRQAAARDTFRRHRRRNAQALDEHLGTSRYPDVATTYPRVDLRPRAVPLAGATEEERRAFGNDLVAAGWDRDAVAHMLNITPRGHQ